MTMINFFCIIYRHVLWLISRVCVSVTEHFECINIFFIKFVQFTFDNLLNQTYNVGTTIKKLNIYLVKFEFWQLKITFPTGLSVLFSSFLQFFVVGFLWVLRKLLKSSKFVRKNWIWLLGPTISVGFTENAVYENYLGEWSKAKWFMLMLNVFWHIQWMDLDNW